MAPVVESDMSKSGRFTFHCIAWWIAAANSGEWVAAASETFDDAGTCSGDDRAFETDPVTDCETAVSRVALLGCWRLRLGRSLSLSCPVVMTLGFVGREAP